jgi:acetyl esterase/lipase
MPQAQAPPRYAGYRRRVKSPLPDIGRAPVWAWRAMMAQLEPRECKRFNADPIRDVEYVHDIDYVGDGSKAHALDVITPLDAAAHPLPVYVYFHGGGWTSGDKATVTKYCASQARAGMVVVNANYRMATRFHMRHIMHDANEALDWVRRNIERFGGDPTRIVLGGDSAGGQIAALLAATTSNAELAAHYGISPAIPARSLRGLVQHCSAVDFSVVFERGFIMSLQFVRMLLPERASGPALERAARFLSPIEWLDAGFPPVFVTTSENDFFYRANLNFIARLKRNAVGVESLIYSRSSRNTRHTWQQDPSYPESQVVYTRLQDFVHRVTAGAAARA